MGFLQKLEQKVKSNSSHLYRDIVEEIALEGLDGITMQALWLRLRHRPGSIQEIDELVKESLWKIIRNAKAFKFYILPKPRSDLIVTNREDYRDDRNALYEPVDAPEDIYVFHPIDDETSGDRGSCFYYKTRTLINCNELPKSYCEVEEKYGNRLVIVGDQITRENLLIGPSEVEVKLLTPTQYCMLERIGRYNGEATRGKNSSNVTKIDPKSQFYYRKLLIKHNLITKQATTMKFGPNKSPATIRIFHLPGFHRLFESGTSAMLRRIINLLKNHPDGVEYTEVLSKSTKLLTKLLVHKEVAAEFEIFFKEVEKPVPTRSRPRGIKASDAEVPMRLVSTKFIKLKDMLNSTEDIIKRINKLDIPEDPSESRWSSICQPETFLRSNSYLHQLFEFLMEAGPAGVSQNDIQDKFACAPLDARSASRLLASKYRIAAKVLHEKNKTKINRFVYEKCKASNKVYQTLEKQTVPKEEVKSINKRKYLQPPGQSISDEHPSKRLRTEENMEVDSSTSVLDDIQSYFMSGTCPDVSTVGGTDIFGFDLSQESIKASIESGKTEETTSAAKSAVFDVDEKCYEYTQSGVKLFLKREEFDFVVDQDSQHNPIFFELEGWNISINEAKIQRKNTLPTGYFISARSLERGNMILQHLRTSHFILGFQSILKNVRCQKGEVETPGIVDRRTLLRIVDNLHVSKQIKIWRIIIFKYEFKRYCTVFTPFETPYLVVKEWLLKISNFAFNTLIKRLKNRRNQKTAILLPPTASKICKQIRKKTLVKATRKKKVALAVNYARKKLIQKKRDKENRYHYHAGSYIDDTDALALRKLKKQRVDWAPIEDRFILTIFIASIIFIPRYNLQRVFIFNSTQIRDILHSKLPESKNKTSSAVRRRLHFLMRNSAFYAHYRYYLSSVLKDDFFYENCVEKHLPKSSSKIYYDVPLKAIEEAFNYLNRNYIQRKRLSRPELEATSSVEEIVLMREKKKVERSNIWQEAMMELQNRFKKQQLLAMELSDDSVSEKQPNFTEEEFDVFYNFLNAVLDKINVMSIPNPEETMQYLFKTKSFMSLCPRIKNFKKQDIVSFHRDPWDIEDVRLWVVRSSLLSLLFHSASYETVDHFMAEISDWSLCQAVFVLRRECILAVARTTHRFSLANLMRKHLQVYSKPVSYRVPGCLLDDLLAEHGLELSFYSNYSTLLLLGQLIQHPVIEFDIELPEGGKVPLDYDDVDIYQDTNTLANRTEKNETDSKSNCFSVPLPLVSVRAKSDDSIPTLKNKFGLNESSLLSILPILSKSVPTSIATLPEPKSNLHTLLQLVEKTESCGISFTFLKEIFKLNPLIEGLNYLVEEKYIFVVGVSNIKFVSWHHVSPWTMPFKFGEYEVERKIIYPWLTCEGECNWRLLDRIFTCVIGMLIRHPVIEVHQVCDYMTPILSKVETLCIVECLVKLRIVRIFEIVQKIPCTLFSMPSFAFKDYTVEWNFEADRFYIELEQQTALKYASFQQLTSPISPGLDAATTCMGHEEQMLALEGEIDLDESFNQ